MTMSPSSSALDAAEDGTMTMSSSALDTADEDDDESVVLGAGCGRERDEEDVLGRCLHRRSWWPMKMTMSPSSSALDAAEDGTMKIC